MKSALPFHGVAVPEVRRIARAQLAAHPLPDRQAWHDTVLELWDGATHREQRYAALGLVRSPRRRRTRTWRRSSCTGTSS
jgi:hypothetical protein